MYSKADRNYALKATNAVLASQTGQMANKESEEPDVVDQFCQIIVTTAKRVS